MLYLAVLFPAGHRMEEQRPQYSLLHLLQVAHPELTVAQIWQLLRYAAVRRSEANAVRSHMPRGCICSQLE